MSADDAIILEKYSDKWPLLAVEEIKRIRELIPEAADWKIEHVGSTSVPGLLAKPIIDLVVELANIQEGSTAITPLESIGYSYWRENPDEKHLFFVKGLPPHGNGRTHHVHFFEPERFKKHTQFSEKLRKSSFLAKEYEALKLELSEKFRHDREAYTEAKTEFIQAALKK